MDFSHEELIETVERFVAGLIERAVIRPPVNALTVAEEHLGIPVRVVNPDPEGDGTNRRRRDAGIGITLTTDMSAEARQRAAADGIARFLLPEICAKLNVQLGPDTKQFAAHLRGLVAPRILVPTKLLRAALKEHKYDIPALHATFATATMEAVALRLLDFDTPCAITVVDDGVVAVRRANQFAVSKKLEAAEQECVEQVTRLDEAHRARKGDWTAWAWPVPNRPFRRILIRSVRDDV
jgi:predicted transcriptional regulator